MPSRIMFSIYPGQRYTHSAAEWGSAFEPRLCYSSVIIALPPACSVSHLVGGLALTALANSVSRGQDLGVHFPTLLVLVGTFAAAYFPTVPLASTLCFRQLEDPDAQFGKVRVWGTVGWMTSGVFLS